MNIHRLHANKGGFTLIESMVAGSVLLVSMVMVAGSLARISQTNAVTQDQAVATAQMMSVSEQIRGMEYTELLAYTPPAFKGLGNSSAIQVTLVDGDGGLVPTPVVNQTTFPNPLEVKVTVTWRDTLGRTYSKSVSAVHRR